MKRVVFGKTGKTREDSTKGIPFAVTIHPKLTFLARKIKELSKYLHIDLEVKAALTPTPMVSFRSAKKIKDYLVRAKLYPLERDLGSRKGNKSRCEVCNNIESTDPFSSTVTGETYKINHYFNCDNKGLVYLITCRTCKPQYKVRPVTPFGSVRTITGAVLEKQRGVKNTNKNICMNTFYKMIIMVF